MTNLPPWLLSRLDALKEDAIYAKCRDWLSSLTDLTHLEQELDRSSGLGWDSSVLQGDLAHVRDRIASLKAPLAHRAGAPSREELETKAHDWVAARAATVTVNTQGGRFEVQPSSENALALMCWLAPELVAKKLVAAATADTSQYLAARARMRDAAKLAESLRELEHREEAIVRRLLENGVAVARRVDASPHVVLGVRVDPAEVANPPGQVAA